MLVSPDFDSSPIVSSTYLWELVSDNTDSHSMVVGIVIPLLLSLLAAPFDVGISSNNTEYQESGVDRYVVCGWVMDIGSCSDNKIYRLWRMWFERREGWVTVHFAALDVARVLWEGDFGGLSDRSG